MTFTQFLRRLRAFRGKFRRESLRYGVLRFRTTDSEGLVRSCCPIDALGGEWDRPGGRLGLRGKMRNSIVEAADAPTDGLATPRQRQIRVAMLEAVGAAGFAKRVGKE